MTDHQYSDNVFLHTDNPVETPPGSLSNTPTQLSEDGLTIPQLEDLVDPSIFNLDRHFDPDLLATFDWMLPSSPSELDAILLDGSKPPSFISPGMEYQPLNNSPVQSPSVTAVSPNFSISQFPLSPEAALSALGSPSTIKRRLEPDTPPQDTPDPPPKRRRRTALEIAREHTGGDLVDFGTSTTAVSSQTEARADDSELSLDEIRAHCTCPRGPPKTKLRRHWDETCDGNPNKTKDFVCRHPGCGSKFGRSEYLKRHQKTLGH